MPANAQQAMEELNPLLTAYGHRLYTLKGLIWSQCCLNALITTKSYYKKTFYFLGSMF